MSPDNTKGEIMPNGESLMDFEILVSKNKTKQKYWFSNLTVQETSGDIVKNASPWACDSKGI